MKINLLPVTPDMPNLIFCPTRQLALLVFTLCCLSLAFAPRPSEAEQISTEEWNISADKVVRYEDPSSIVASGNVVLIKSKKLPPRPPKKKTEISTFAELLGEKPKAVEEVAADEAVALAEPKYQTAITIKADWMVYDIELETIKAKGNLQILTEEDQLFAKEGRIHLATETGEFKKAMVLRNEDSLHFEGESIEKTGFDTYRIVDGWAITCKVEEGTTPPWSFHTSKAEIRQGGYALLKNARFNIKNVPIFYSPYLVVPVKNTRQTGFILPEFASSDVGGFSFGLPFFWAISDSMDLTLFPEYYIDRGFMSGAEFRYMLSDSNKGAITGNYLKDSLSDPSETDYYADTGYTHDNDDRYWLRGKFDHTFNNVWQTRMDLDIVSDQDYLREFETGTTGFDRSQDRYFDVFGRGFQNDTETLRQNKLNILRSWSGMSLEAQFLGINNASTLASDTNTPLMKLPSIDFNGSLPTGIADITLDWDTDYVNYWREDGIGANRFDIRPVLSSPIPLSPYLESRAEIGLRDTFYLVETYGDAEFDEDTTQNRLLAEFEADIATTWERDFFTNSGPGKTIRHQLRPYTKYGYIPDVDQDDLPQLDSVDTISEKNAITYGIDNFFNWVKSSADSFDELSEYAYFQIEQSYDLRSENSDEPFSDIFGKLRWKPFKRARLEYKTLFDVYDSEFNSHTFESRFNNSRGDFISLDYSFKEQEDIDQINAGLGATFFDRWLFEASIEHSIQSDETNNARGSITYKALCWSVRFETRYQPAETTYFVLFNLANIGVPLGIGI